MKLVNEVITIHVFGLTKVHFRGLMVGERFFGTCKTKRDEGGQTE